MQDSAYPYHDWNERITRECYGPNAAARIIDAEGKIVKIANNYARISFNFGPTLLAWLEASEPEIYASILAADRESQNRFSGHGSAIAQTYNHMILPLANRRDKYTQVLWGVRDFEARFGRSPEGMWLPETAVDVETLDIMAELGLRFTVLAQHQARRVRPVGSSNWKDVSGGRVDPTTAYQVRLPSERTMNVFFYDGPVSRAIAFDGVLRRGEDFANRLASAFLDSRPWPQLVNTATDGETYGHHHRHGEMALAFALDYIESNGIARLTNYGEFLEKHPPTHEVVIADNTSWSCAHGVERWRSHCGCATGDKPGWTQEWRGPLREALDWLRDALAPEYEKMAGRLLKDPWMARDAYVSAVLNRSSTHVEEFLKEQASQKLDEEAGLAVLRLLELQRHLMLMYTSCGWFFGDVSRIETVQVLQYAGRAIQLAEQLFQRPLEDRFLKRLEAAKSNVPDYESGRTVYEKLVKPAKVDLEGVTAHYAVSSLFESYGDHTQVYCYRVDREDFQTFEAGKAKLAIGRVRVTSEITADSERISFGALHFGDHNINGGVRPLRGDQAYRDLVESMSDAFYRADFPEVIRLMDRHFGESTYSISSLFRDEQRKVLNQILTSTLASVDQTYDQLYQQNAPLMYFLGTLNVPLPKAFQSTAEIVLNTNLRRALSDVEPDVRRIRALLKDAEAFQIPLDGEGLGYALKETVDSVVGQLSEKPAELSDLRRVDVLQTAYPEFRNRAGSPDGDTKEWVDRFRGLGEKLGVRVE